MSQERILLIGGGPNGLIAATRLAAAGRKVLLLEQRATLGGLAGPFSYHPGYQSAGVLNDTAGLADEVISALNLTRHGLVLQTPGSILVPDGQRGLILAADPQAAAAEIAAYSQKDAERYLAWTAFLARIRPVILSLVRDLPSGVEGLATQDLMGLLKKGMAMRRLGRKDFLEILRISMMCTGDWLTEWFETDLLKAALAVPAHLGSFTGPWSPGTTLNLLLAHCSRGKAVQGGTVALVQVLEKAARAEGVEIRTGATVHKILIQDGKATGVVLADGERLDATTVVSACHPARTLLDFVDPLHLPTTTERNLLLYRSRGTTAMVHLALKGKPEFRCRPDAQAPFVRVVRSLNQLEQAFDPSKYRELPTEPALEIHRGTFDNSAAAPKDHESLTVMVHFVPYTLEGGWSDAAKAKVAESVLSTLAPHVPNLKEMVAHTDVQSPVDLERVYGTTGGHIYHGELALDQLLVRPTLDCTNYATPLQGLYLCGNGTRGGGGLTGLPGLLAANRLLAG